MTEEKTKKEDHGEVTIEKLSGSARKELFLGTPASPRLGQLVRRILSPVLSAAPETVQVMANNGKYLVKFSAEGNRALQSGVAKFLERKDGSRQATLVMGGRITEIPSVIGPAKQAPAAKLLSVGQLVVVLALQNQLATMEQSLARIEAKLGKILEHLEGEQVARLKSHLEKLDNLGDELATGEWTSDRQQRWLIGLDRTWDELSIIKLHARDTCENTASGIDKMNLTVKPLRETGTTLRKAFDSGLSKYQRNEELLLMSLLGLAEILRLRALLGEVVDAGKLKKELDEAICTSKGFLRRATGQILEFQTIFKNSKHDIGIRKTLAEHVQSNEGRLDDVVQEIRSNTSFLKVGYPPVSAIVEIVDCAVETVSFLESESITDGHKGDEA